MAEIISLTKSQYELWNRFCLESDDAWFWHTTDWLEYSLAYCPTYKSELISFVLLDDTGLMAICPLILEKPQDKGHVLPQFANSAFDGYVIVPALKNGLSTERREKILKIIFAEVDRLAINRGLKNACFRFSALTNRTNQQYNYLIRNGFLNCSLSTQLISLVPSLDELWASVRKGHKYDINRGKKAFFITIFDSDNINKEVFDQYRLLHHKAAGRITRPLETFEMMFQWIKAGRALLCGLSCEEKFVGFAFVLIYKQGAYYLSASDDPDFKSEVPISHVIQWAVIGWLKDHGYKNYETGIQHFGLQLYDRPSAKDLSIAFFKRGFGGQTYPYFRGEKFYDAGFMKTIMKDRLEGMMNYA